MGGSREGLALVPGDIIIIHDRSSLIWYGIKGEKKWFFECYIIHLYCDISVILISNGSVMSSVLASSGVSRRLESQLGQTKDYEINICCISAKHA